MYLTATWLAQLAVDKFQYVEQSRVEPQLDHQPGSTDKIMLAMI